jgi:hypothetical protein
MRRRHVGLCALNNGSLHCRNLSRVEGRPHFIAGIRERRSCQVGPGNFTPSPSQIRT